MKYSYYITSDATCDLPKQFYTDEFSVIPMGYVINGELFDGTPENSLAPDVFYKKVRDGAMPTTSLINEQTAIDFFTPILEKGYDILHICFSSALSGSYKNMLIAADELKKQFPEREIYIIDSKCASLGEGFLVYYVLKKRAEGMSFNDNIKFAEDFKNHCHHDFTVDNLMHLHRGGRVSKTAAIVGTAMKVKPVLITDTKGRLIPVGKVIGRKKALISMVDTMMKKTKGIDNSELVLIGHGDSYNDAKFVADRIKKKFGYENIVIDYIGPVIGSHSGPGTVALFYIGTDKE